MADLHEPYMHRCLELAKLGEGYVAPNPMVGAVLVYEGRIIGEGYHRQYGQAHAEVNCINSVAEADKQYLPAATLYVSLEPCAHHGKTPPCSDLIIATGIRHVVIGCRDPFPEVDGKGIEKLQAAGVQTIMGVLEKECIALNKRFFTFHQQYRPYVVLKWAQTADAKIASGDGKRLMISGELTNRLVHHWRASEAAILVGTRTAMADDPSLDNRLWSDRSPVRLVIDLSLRLPLSLKIFNRQQRTIVFNYQKQEDDNGLLYYRFTEGEDLIEQLMKACYQVNIQSVLVEGGAMLLQTFIDREMFDEVRIITNTGLIAEEGLPAPSLSLAKSQSETIGEDSIAYYIHPGKFRTIGSSAL